MSDPSAPVTLTAEQLPRLVSPTLPSFLERTTDESLSSSQRLLAALLAQAHESYYDFQESKRRMLLGFAGSL